METSKMFKILKKSKCPKLPVVRKCCFCVPVYSGIAIFGYIDLILDLITIPMLVYELVDECTDQEKEPDAQGSDMITLTITLILTLVNIAQTVLLLVGAHKRNKLLLKIYFYMGIIFELVSLIIDVQFMDFTNYTENVAFFILLVLYGYLLFLVHNVVYVREDSREIQYIAYEQHRDSV